MGVPYFDNPAVFTPAECDTIVALAGCHALEPATVWSGTQDHVDPRVRQAECCHLSRDACEWIYDRLDTLFAAAAARLDIGVDPLFEDIQLVRYRVGAHFQTWHSDAGADRQGERLISASVELSEAGDYAGGVLEIVPVLGMPRTLPRGGARLFQSRMLHRVTPVTSGVRDALVAWTGRRR